MTAACEIDFASQRRRNSPRLVLVCALIALVVAAMWWRAAVIGNALSAVNQKLADLASATQETPVESAHRTSLDPQQAAAVNQAISQLNVPWAATFRAIETRRPPDVAILRLEPRPAERRLRVTAEAQDAESLFGFARGLSEDAAFVSIAPVRQERVEDEGGRASLKLTIDMEWRL